MALVHKGVSYILEIESLDELYKALPKAPDMDTATNVSMPFFMTYRNYAAKFKQLTESNVDVK